MLIIRRSWLHKHENRVYQTQNEKQFRVMKRRPNLVGLIPAEIFDFLLYLCDCTVTWGKLCTCTYYGHCYYSTIDGIHVPLIISINAFKTFVGGLDEIFEHLISVLQLWQSFKTQGFLMGSIIVFTTLKLPNAGFCIFFKFLFLAFKNLQCRIKMVPVANQI